MSTTLNYGQVQSQLNSLQNSLNQLDIDVTSNIDTDISSKNTLLTEKQKRKIEQEKEIEEKNKLILTRARMLQLSQEKNMYKKKIIYSLIAILFLLIIVTLSTYVFYSKKKMM